MKHLSRLMSVLFIFGIVLALAAPVYAGAYLYAGKRKKVNCGVAVIGRLAFDSSKSLNGSDYSQLLKSKADNATSGVGDLFWLLETMGNVKPASWSFDNPNPMYNPETTGNIDKRNPYYWYVDISSARDLSEMHVLYMPVRGSIDLNNQEREALRSFVDNGGVLWVDNASDSSHADFGDSFIIHNFKFENGSATGFDVPVSRHHPLISVPFWLSNAEIANLGMLATGDSWSRVACKPGYDDSSSSMSIPDSMQFDVLLPVVKGVGSGVFGGGLSVAANSYGSGRIVATSNFVGRGCFNYYPYNLPSVKFAYNVVSWASSWTHPRKNPRQSGYSFDTVGGTRLLKSWALTPNVPMHKSSFTVEKMELAPVIYKNVVFYSTGKALYAVDLWPTEDLDDDGNPDDGLSNSASDLCSEGADIIWEWPTAGAAMPIASGASISSPVVVSMLNPKAFNTSYNPTNDGPKALDVVLITTTGDSVTKVIALEAFPPSGLLPASPDVLFEWDVPVNAPSAESSGPHPPIYSNGWIYVVGVDGCLYGYNAAKDEYWSVPGGGSITPGTADPVKSAPVFGYMKSDSGGTVVGMVYWAAPSSTDPPANNNDFIYGVPVYVSGDRLKPDPGNTGLANQAFTTNYNAYISDVPEPVVYYYDSTGNLTTLDNDNIRFNEAVGGNERPGMIVVQQQLPADVTLYATYALDYDPNKGRHYTPAINQPLEPSSPAHAVPPIPATVVNSTLALGPGNMMYLGSERDISGTPHGGSIYGLYSDGNPPVTKWNYFLHAGTSIPSSGGTSSGYNAIASIPSSVPGLTEMDCFSSPVVAGDKVFVTVTGTLQDTGEQASALLCLKADPGFTIRITNNGAPKRLVDPVNGRPMSVKIWQPNLFNDVTIPNLHPLAEAIPVNRDMINYEEGVITIENFNDLKLRSGAMATNILSSSLPVWVFLNNVEVPIDFSTYGPSQSYLPPDYTKPLGDAVDLSQWNNLLWYYLVTPDDGGSAKIDSSPVVIGDKVFFTTNDGRVFGLKADTGETGGIETKQTPFWKEKVSDVSSANRNFSIAGANGVLLVPQTDGLHAYANMNTIVADSNRIVELDGAGEISWSMDSIQYPVAIPDNASGTPERRTVPINKPASVKIIESGDMLVVNSGANQVYLVARNGQVNVQRVGDYYFRWVFDKFRDPKRLLRPGQPTEILNPTDALLWQETRKNEKGQDVELIIHCMVADSGNHRIVDLIYRIDLVNSTFVKADEMRSLMQDSASGYWLPELNWVTVTETQDQKYIFNCIQSVHTVDNSGSGDVLIHDIWAAVANYATGTHTDPVSQPVGDQGLGGAIVDIRYRVLDGGEWDYNTEHSGEIVARCDRFSNDGMEQLLSNPKSFQVIDEYGAGRNILFCDSNGVYYIRITGGGSIPYIVPGAAPLTDEAYRNILRQVENTDSDEPDDQTALNVPLVANSVQMLPNGNWLITNGFSGANIGGENKFHGEVFEYSPDPAGVVWHSPALKFDGVATNWSQSMENSYPLQQPRCALRKY